MNIIGTGHLAYYNGTACPITVPYEGIPWMKMAKNQFVEKIDEWCSEMGLTQTKVATLWYVNVYTLQHFLDVEVDNDFGILHTYEKTK